jgi:putative ATP-dependent endonuclease of OLD family
MLDKHREAKVAKASGQGVETFVSDEWTLEYDLALGSKHENGSFTGGLAADVFVAACCADQDDAINAKTKKVADVISDSLGEFAALKAKSKHEEGCTAEEVLAVNVYAKFAQKGVSKAIAAQYLAERLQKKVKDGKLMGDELRAKLPKYLTAAIDYVTRPRKEDPAHRPDKGAQ